MHKHYIVYKITNLLNNKFYIGSHRTNNLNDSYMGGGVAINAAIKKYGKEHFIKEILYHAKSIEDMFSVEEKFVSESYEHELSYNIAKNGRYCNLTSLTIEKIRKSKKGVKFSDEHKKNLSLAHKGRQSPNKNKKLSDEHKKNLSLAHKGKTPGNKGKSDPRYKTRNNLKTIFDGKNYIDVNKDDIEQYLSSGWILKGRPWHYNS